MNASVSPLRNELFRQPLSYAGVSGDLGRDMYA
jgi:hypothetical protein